MENSFSIHSELVTQILSSIRPKNLLYFGIGYFFLILVQFKIVYKIMDYFENAQIGGYRINMPFPQLFYPEMNGTNKSYDQAGAPHLSGQQFQSDYYDSGCKPDLGHSPYGCNEDYPPRHSVTNSSFAYRSMDRHNRRAREMLARNGLYTPNDRGHKQPEYPQFADDSIGQSVTVNSYWQ